MSMTGAGLRQLLTQQHNFAFNARIIANCLRTPRKNDPHGLPHKTSRWSHGWEKKKGTTKSLISHSI